MGTWECKKCGNFGTQGGNFVMKYWKWKCRICQENGNVTRIKELCQSGVVRTSGGNMGTTIGSMGIRSGNRWKKARNSGTFRIY
jgi:hypothetical protein